MNKIKFSHRYEKLHNLYTESGVILIQVFECKLSELSKEFLEYDTKIVDAGFYKLTSKENLVLIFKTFNGKIFTTVRRSTPEKRDYYKSKIGKQFQVEYVE